MQHLNLDWNSTRSTVSSVATTSPRDELSIISGQASKFQRETKNTTYSKEAERLNSLDGLQQRGFAFSGADRPDLRRSEPDKSNHSGRQQLLTDPDESTNHEKRNVNQFFARRRM